MSTGVGFGVGATGVALGVVAAGAAGAGAGVGSFEQAASAAVTAPSSAVRRVIRAIPRCLSSVADRAVDHGHRTERRAQGAVLTARHRGRARERLVNAPGSAVGRAEMLSRCI
ncbi:hypothetical protein GCM10022197_31810 [Microlunatus spumicola]|uniref:Uncharacterized protein n=1 Tax=Microlunatus spumicola TaxID=81499 RepID=A0ABP6XV58_9ACTN